jgi:hypothetical protein
MHVFAQVCSKIPKVDDTHISESIAVLDSTVVVLHPSCFTLHEQAGIPMSFGQPLIVHGRFTFARSSDAFNLL